MATGRSISLGGRIALVTGGTRNIGLEVARAFAQCGASGTVVGNRAGEHLGVIERELAIASGADWTAVAADLADSDAVTGLVEAATVRHGAIDILVNIAAVRPHAALESITVEDWDRVFAINVRAPFLLAQRVLPAMKQRGWGRIVNVSGIDAFWGKVNRAHVTSSKAAIDGLSRVLASEAGDSGVTVNTVVPGTIDTQREPREWWPDLDDFYARRIERIPMQRLGRPTEIADACLFLVSDLSSYITGHSLHVSGGAFPMVRRE